MRTGEVGELHGEVGGLRGEVTEQGHRLDALTGEVESLSRATRRELQGILSSVVD